MELAVPLQLGEEAACPLVGHRRFERGRSFVPASRRVARSPPAAWWSDAHRLVRSVPRAPS